MDMNIGKDMLPYNTEEEARKLGGGFVKRITLKHRVPSVELLFDHMNKARALWEADAFEAGWKAAKDYIENKSDTGEDYTLPSIPEMLDFALRRPENLLDHGERGDREYYLKTAQSLAQKANARVEFSIAMKELAIKIWDISRRGGNYSKLTDHYA